MRHRVILPCRDALVADFELKVSQGSFVDCNREVVLFGRRKVGRFVSGVFVGCSVDGDADYRSSIGDLLRNDHGSEITIFFVRYYSSIVCLAYCGCRSSSQTDCGVSLSVQNENLLASSSPFLVSESRAFHKRHPDSGHPMSERQHDNPVGRGSVLRLSPQEVRSLVTARFAVKSLGTLILFNFERIFTDFVNG